MKGTLWQEVILEIVHEKMHNNDLLLTFEAYISYLLMQSSLWTLHSIDNDRPDGNATLSLQAFDYPGILMAAFAYSLSTWGTPNMLSVWRRAPLRGEYRQTTLTATAEITLYIRTFLQKTSYLTYTGRVYNATCTPAGINNVGNKRRNNKFLYICKAPPSPSYQKCRTP